MTVRSGNRVTTSLRSAPVRGNPRAAEEPFFSICSDCQRWPFARKSLICCTYHILTGPRFLRPLSDYRVETTFQTLGRRSTKVEISHYYSTTTLKAKLLNLIVKGKISRDTQATLNAAKAAIEACLSRGIEVYIGPVRVTE